MDLARLLDHAWRDVIAGKTAPMAFGAQKAPEVAEAAANVDDGSLRAAVEQVEKLPVTPFMRLDPVPVDAKRRCAMGLEL